jgi:bacillithiol biosynthesis cysteine-adding enzyme BshC
MGPRSIPYTDLPAASRLFLDFLYDFDRVRDFYAFAPRESSSYASAAAALQYPLERRAALVDALRKQNGEHASLDLLAHPGTWVVATGQQVGLFTGPAYAIYKALTAARLARQLTEQGLPSVPVFWLASEDHDLDEVNHCWVFDSTHRPLRIEAGGDGHSQEPVGRIPISGSPAEDLRQALRDLPFAGQVMALAEETFVPGRTFGAAFARLLQRLLSSYRLLCLDPLQPEVRELAAPVLGRAVGNAPDLVRLVLERSQVLEAVGYHAQVRVDRESSLLFLLEGGRRLPLLSQDGGFLCGGRRFSASELVDRAADLSPNALLRPVVQDYILPTVASVVGPAEVAYMAQSEVLYRALLDRMPVVVPRASFTLVDRHAARLLGRYGLSLASLFGGEDALRERIARKLIPPLLGRRLEDAAAEANALAERLRADLMSFDPTLAEAMERSRRKILYQLAKIERKVSREALRRNQRAAEEAAYLGRLLYPQKRLQERLYSILPFLAEHGLGLIDTIYENVRLDSPDHQLLLV